MSKRLLQSLEDGFPWGTIGAALSIVFFAASVYLSLFYGRSAQFRVETLTSSQVYAIREDVRSLEIKFEGDDIRARGLTLSVLTARISNPSRVDILKSFYDENAPVTFTVPNARIIEFGVPSASSDYLAKHVVLVRHGDSALQMSPVILEQGNFFVLRLLVLHGQSSPPGIDVSGKIAGVQRFELIETPRPNGVAPSFWRTAFNGDALIQISRVVGYGLAALLLLVLLIFILVSVPEKLTVLRRRRLARAFIRTLEGPISPAEVELLNRYARTGESFVVEIHKLVHEPKRLKDALNLTRPRRRSVARRSEHPVVFAPPFFRPLNEAIAFLRENGNATSEDDALRVDPRLVESVDSLLLFLRAHVPDRIKQAQRELRFETSSRASMQTVTVDEDDSLPPAASGAGRDG